MKKINIIVIDDNKDILNQIKEYFRFSNKINVLDVCDNIDQGLIKIIEKEKELDILILDLVLPKKDGFYLLEKLNKQKYNFKIIVLTSCSNSNIINEIFNYNIDYYITKPFNLLELEKKIGILASIPVKNNDEIKIIEILYKIGIPSNLKGFNYIKSGIILAINKNVYITKDIYPELAKKYQTNYSSVERTIRHAIEIGWNRGDIDFINEVFGSSVDILKSKPTNSEFIITIATKFF